VKYLAALLFIAGFLTDPLSITFPAFPPGAIDGGTVVATLHVSRGAVEYVELLSGGEPFADYARAALYNWRFAPIPRTEEVLVVVRFRQPGHFSMGGLNQTLLPMTAEPRLPFPTRMVEPAYPTGAPRAGSVVLLLDISPSGNVVAVHVVEPLGILTETSAEAALNWHFEPATNAYGVYVPSQAYAVIVFSAPYF
jgi:hypothetical protein